MAMEIVSRERSIAYFYSKYCMKRQGFRRLNSGESPGTAAPGLVAARIDDCDQ
jgi:hypothetical protein